MLALACVGVLTVAGAAPAAAVAHGPVAPVALDYLARVAHVPAGLDAKVVDGDQRVWLRVNPGLTVVVLDYRGAPYLRFTRSGVQVNRNSVMRYLNETPLASMPPAGLGPLTPPVWRRVSGGHDYEWHDGRVHALAATALAAGASFVGAWSVPILVDGRRSSVTGGLWYTGPPSVLWFWPIAVLLLCVSAAWRLRRPRLDQWTARLLALADLASLAVAGFGRELHGRPAVSAFQLVELAVILTFAGWGLFRVLVQRPGAISYIAIAIAALWEGLGMVPTLLHGFVLIAVPAFVARAATVSALGAGAGLFLMAIRIYDWQDQPSAAGAAIDENDSVWGIA